MRSASAIRENGVPRRPHCPLHVCVEMALIEEAAPGWVQAAEEAEEIVVKRGRGIHRRWKRKSWKCPAPGCYRVAAYAPTDGEEKKLSVRKCRKCGAPSDQPGDARVTGRGSLCRSYCREKEALRVARQRARDGAGAHGGNPSSAGGFDSRRPLQLPQAEPEPEDALDFAESGGLLGRWRSLPSASEAVQ